MVDKLFIFYPIQQALFANTACSVWQMFNNIINQKGSLLNTLRGSSSYKNLMLKWCEWKQIANTDSQSSSLL